jgi:hypothetical protein
VIMLAPSLRRTVFRTEDRQGFENSWTDTRLGPDFYTLKAACLIHLECPVHLQQLLHRPFP